MVVKIEEPEALTYEFIALPSLIFEVILVPPNSLEMGFGGEDLDSRSIDVPKSNGSIWFRVYTLEIEKVFVAHATFAASAETVQCDTISVMEKYRRQGVATVLYDLAAEVFEGEVVPSNNLTEEAIRFWENRSHNVCICRRCICNLFSNIVFRLSRYRN
jgi:GNAT superfamily N-acetyltransferase